MNDEVDSDGETIARLKATEYKWSVLRVCVYHVEDTNEESTNESWIGKVEGDVRLRQAIAFQAKRDGTECFGEAEDWAGRSTSFLGSFD